MGIRKSAKNKKPVSKKTTTKSRVAGLHPKSSNDDAAINSIEHYNGILIEELKSEFKFVIEHVTGVEDRLGKRMDDLAQKMESRFESVESVLKYHSSLHQHHGQILEKHSQMLEHHGALLSKNEEDHARFESKLDAVIEKVEKHDRDIQKINSEVFAS